MQPELTEAYLLSQGLSKNFPERFWAKVNKTESCWLWTGSLNRNGYGRLKQGVGRRSIPAHRASWILHMGPIPNKLHVLHNCPIKDNKSCVNPKHLWIGTNGDNVRDAVKKGLHKPEKHAYKLTHEKVFEIRSLWSLGRTQPSIAKEFGVTRKHVGFIVNNKSWKF